MVCVDHNVTQKKIYILSWCATLYPTREVILISKSLVISIIEPNHVISYTAGWNIWGEWFLAGNQGNHQHFDPSWYPRNFDQLSKFLEKKIQNGRLKKTEFFKIANSQNCFAKISWVSRIDWCEGHWCGSIYMVVRLSDISSKTA